jgi:hypothetical protein
MKTAKPTNPNQMRYGATDSPPAGANIVGSIIFEKVTYDRTELIEDEYGTHSIGSVIDGMIEEYKMRGEQLRSLRLNFNEER